MIVKTTCINANGNIAYNVKIICDVCGTIVQSRKIKVSDDSVCVSDHDQLIFKLLKKGWRFIKKHRCTKCVENKKEPQTFPISL